MALCAIKKLFLATKWEHPVASNCISAELRFPRLATLVGSSSHANRIAHGYYGNAFALVLKILSWATSIRFSRCAPN